ncbi:amino acid adenylation domain-containing protein [Nostoc sp. CHAB 5784]|uniref:non-ribosomal peptide synthetase n=1 Tax=Nostoc mirabile TaxID=2907820 RepID=UPI001E5490CC|nr:non-ribosomal peptide synthetase [Nostoc mirabile]MCC5666990.1 amino acid adenylation domain-containing protein [Nostoc mirabile CHAB5784]
MNLNQFLAELAQRGVKLWVEDGQLRYRAPKGVLTPELRDDLALHKAEVVKLLHQSNANRRDADLPLVKVERDRDLPLSFAQARMWFLSQLEPNNPFYNEPQALRLHGFLNLVALEKSLNKIIARHSALRTNFVKVDGQPVQVIAESLTLSIPVVDLRDIPESEREISAQRLAIAEAQQPFDLASSPLIRTCVLKLTEVEHVLLLTIHHIVWDGWSWGILLRELATLYSAFCNDLSPELPELSIQYKDFAVWQRQWLLREVLESQLAYWKQQLEGAPALLELPTDRVRPATQTYRGAHHKFVLSKELTLAVVSLSQRSGVTLFITLLAAFQTLLYRYTGQTDICVGTPHANRDRPEIESLIGFFVNTLVLRTSLSGNPSFEDVLSRVRDVTLLAHAHQDLPFEKLVEELKLERDLSYTPLAQVMLVLNVPMPQIQMAGLTVSPLPIETATAKFDLTLSFENTASGLIGDWEYNTDLFDASTIARMARHFQTLLEGIVANPQQRVSQLPLLEERERHQLLVEWNNTTKEYPFDKCIHQLFEEQVERSPDTIAVVFEDKQLTYREMNQRANCLAHHLKTLGVGPEVLVGICVERSLEMVVGLLGILKAGGAYVPLDPTYPTERLHHILEDSGVQVLLTLSQLVKSLPKHQARVVCLDTNWEQIALHSDSNPIHGVTRDNLAYVIYTSGSTGRPKGVAIEHHSTVALLTWAKEVFATEDLAGVLASTSICFDLSVFELFVPLSWGGLVILAQNALDLPTLPAAAQVTLINTVPTAMAELVRSQGIPASVRIVNLAGEPLQNQLVQQIYQLPNVQQVFNLYGPSEDTTYSTFALIKKGDTLVTIGRPIANTQVYLLDKKLQPVPIGVPGELYIGGDGLARGYLNRPDLTQEKFISNPFSNQPNSRLYKTGDKARYLTDGNIEFKGRLDNQVKIRGFRIELGEIETAIAQYPGVRETAVIAREDVPGQKYLAAYIVPNHSEALASSDLRGFLKEKLPDYMIPGAFVILSALPLTPNGKVDRRALPAPDFQPELQRSSVAPRTPIEEMLASIWTDVLRIELVGVHHNFFELGGHSLLATQVISRVRDTFAVELPLRSLFEAPTIAEFASRVENSLKNGQSQEALPLLPIPRSESIPLSFAQARLWFLDQLQPNSAFYNIPLALRLSGQLNIAALQSSINEIIQRHEALRTNFTTQEGQPVAVIAATLNCQLQVVNLLHIRESELQIEAQRLAFEEANRPFNLEREPLLRSMVQKLGETEYVLLFTMHHIISDGWSLGVFTHELTELYKAFGTGITPVLPSLPVQYADFALWQRQWLQGEKLEAQLDYWKQQLKNAPALLELPTDRPRPAVQTYRGRYHYAALSLELSGKLSALSKRTGVTLFMTLLAAFVTLLYRITSSDDIVVGTPVAGRNRQEIERLIGFFVNTLVLRTHLGGDPSFEDVLSRVREVALGAYTHQDLPFEQLVEALQPTRSLSYTPLFQVMFALDEKSVPSFELPELTVSSYAVEIGTAKFDLTLSMENTADGLVGVWEYNADLFDETTIARMAGHFQTLLKGIVANPQQRVPELSLLTLRERHQLLVEWNNTQTEYPQDKCIHQLFEEQVERNPDAIAVVFEDKQLTYRELNQRANCLAHHLKTLGVGSEVLVGICVERSLKMMVGLLGILKAGGAYVPLDPQLPHKRLSFMLSDSSVPVLLTSSKLMVRLPENKARVVCLDTDWEIISHSSEENPVSSVGPQNLAYVIYTSGSTGQPKGTLIIHQGLVNYLSWCTKAYAVADGSGAPVHSSIGFDATITSLFSPLLVGKKVVLLPEKQEIEALGAILCSQSQFSLVKITPAHLDLLSFLIPNWSANNQTRAFIIGGEALSGKSVSFWRESAPSTKLINEYGPTETVVGCCVYEVNAQTSLSGGIPIGRPIANTQLYILDRYLQPVPIGVLGELYIGGAGLARGYLNRPDLTESKFIPNPFSNEPGSRLYKTGDKARYLPDGNIEFKGRLDNQVKIRGFRIELGEIEAVLTQHPEVDQAVVVVHEDQPSNQRLVAYIVSTERLNSIEDLTHKIKTDLRQQLPEYMVPVTLMRLSALPLTPNGKVDRRALPPPEPVMRSLSLEMPQTKVEKLIADVWQKILLLEKVGRDDNFFDLGGNSLRLIQVLQKLQIIFTKELSMVEMFQHPTVRALGQLLSEQRSQTPDAPKSEAERAELRSNSQGSMNQRRNIRQQYRSPKKP